MQGDRPLDVICIGRAAVDLYGDQIGARLEDVTSFARYLGGSPANTAVGCARLGLRAAMLTRVGDEQNGRFVRQALAREGVDISQVRTDPQHLTALVFLSIRSSHAFPLLFYRDRCADMALEPADIDPRFIARSAAILISGTHLSQPTTLAACRAAIAAARAAGTAVVLDIDYRPVLWGLRPKADGETRFVASAAVTEVLQSVVPDCDLVVGTEEEICIAGNALSADEAARKLRSICAATLVVKRGAEGCTVYPGPDPASVDVPGFPVEVFNVLGAGDAFMAGFLSGWLRAAPPAECGRRANACGAIVVGRHGCAPAIPTARELEHFLQQPSVRVRDDPTLNYLHRVTTRRPAPAWVAALAFDHRVPFEQLATELAAPRSRIAEFKQLVARAAGRASRSIGATATCGLIVDDRYGAELLPELDEAGWWIARPVEQPNTRPLRFEHGRNVQSMLREWPAHHVAKCLVAFDPDDPPELSQRQIDALLDLDRACADTQRELMLEVLPPAVIGDARDADEVLLRAVRSIAAAGVRPDWWKLPAPANSTGWARLAAAISSADPHCRGVLVLGLDAPLEELGDRLAAAARQPLCRGFAVGRTIFGDAARAWFANEIDDEAAVGAIAHRYLTLMRRFADARTGASPDPFGLIAEGRRAVGTSQDSTLHKETRWSASDSSASD
jgi:5-dehydro-2-deoxygluconokinase